MTDDDLQRSSSAVWATTLAGLLVLLGLFVGHMVFSAWLGVYDLHHTVFHGGSTWNWLAAFSLGIVLVLFFLLVHPAKVAPSQDDKKTILYLYLHGISVVAALFFLIAASGGLMESPFSAYLALYLAVVAIITTEQKHVIRFLVGLMVVVVLLLYLDLTGMIAHFKCDDADGIVGCRIVYAIVSCSSILLAYVADRSKSLPVAQGTTT